MNAPPSHLLTFGDFRLELEERRLLRSDGTEVPLTPRVFETLRYLVEHAGHLVDKRAIMDAVWSDCLVEENNLAQAISKLRQVFGEKAGAQRYIATIPGRGYRFIAPVNVGNGFAVAGIGDPGLNRNIVVPEKPGSSIPATARRAGSIAAVVGLLFVIAAVISWRSATNRPPVAAPNELTASIPEKSIAVLPFESLSDDRENAYFAAGIQDEILTRLSKIAALKVISRGSTQKFKSAPDNLREVARQLGVAHLLEGSVQRSGDSVRVTVQLIHAGSDTHLWAETYDRKLTDMFQVETEVAQRIATALEATLTGSEKQALKAKPTTNVEAHHAYLRGRYFWSRRTSEGYRKAVEQFNRAIELDPAYAQAYSGLADAIHFLSGYNAPEQREALTRVRAALNKAIELDETLAEPHASLGLIAMNIDWDWAEAEREFKRAIELNANYATAHQWYGEFLAYLGRFEEGIKEIERAHELDPLSLIITTDVAKVYAMARRYDAAIAQYQRALAMDPDFPEAHALLGVTYSMKGLHPEAVAELHKIKDVDGNPAYLSWLGYAYGMSGNADEADKIVNQLNELSTHTYVSPLWMTLAHIRPRENDQAFAWLEKVFAERAGGGAVSLKVNPIFDSLRSDPRFADLLRRAKLPP